MGEENTTEEMFVIEGSDKAAMVAMLVDKVDLGLVERVGLAACILSNYVELVADSSKEFRAMAEQVRSLRLAAGREHVMLAAALMTYMVQCAEDNVCPCGQPDCKRGSDSTPRTH